MDSVESEKTGLQEEATRANFKLLHGDKYCGELEDDPERLREEMMESALQHQLQIMHDEEALGKIRSELSVLQEELELSKSRGAEREHEIVSKAVIIQELNQELDQHKASYAHLREDLLSLESLVSVLKEELLAKDDNLEETLLKLQQETRRRETIEESLRTHELQILGLHDELYRENEVKSALEITVGVLNNHLHQLKEFCVDLENKLNVSEQNLSRYDSLLSQALSHNSELEQKLKSLYVFHNEPATFVHTSFMKKIQLEETKDENLTQENSKLSESDREKSEDRRRAVEVTGLLKTCEEKTGMSASHFQEYENEVNKLEFSLETSLKELEEKCTELENWVSLSHEHNQELQKLVQESHSKAEDSGKKVGELQLQLEITRCQVRELEEQLSIAEGKLKNAFAEIRQYNSHVSELSSELEAFHVKSSSLEMALQAANDTERDLTEMLSRVTEEKNRIEDAFKISGRKLLEAESLIEILQLELKSSMEKLQNVDRDLENSGDREREILEKSKTAVEMLYHQGGAVDKASAQNLDLVSYDASDNNLEEKLREEMLKFTEKHIEARQSLENLKSGGATTENLAAPKVQLDERSCKLTSLEKTDGFRKNHEITEGIAEKSFSAYERSSEVNRLKGEVAACQYKVDQYNDIGLSVNTEKESSVKELERSTLIYSDVKESTEELNYLQNQMQSHEKNICEDPAAAEFQKAEFDGSLSRLRTLEGMLKETQSKWIQLECDNDALTGENLKLTLDVTLFETKLNDLQSALNTVLAEKNSLLNQRHEVANKRLREVMAQMDEKRNEQREREYSPNDNVETLTVKPEMEARTAELEWQLLSSETPLKKEVESMRALLGEKEAAIAHILEEKKRLAEEMVQLRSEINLQHKNSQRRVLLILFRNSDGFPLCTAQGEVAESQSKDEVEPKSRDLSPAAGTASEIYEDKRSKGALQPSEAEEPPAAMAFKFLLGVALASIILGIILGKRF
ncbi:unnamed protein product [Spirodela intermedia]|uniref:Uncharacterized protein n=1 Tax=Spirodela intermedia TaxID=51605 RepID=A0A7I8JNV8_SPIIN|nr:unnamed protein product [Spirodela intermedia]CAA6671858.1 unnamed protein product [Spirodela intermedia]